MLQSLLAHVSQSIIAFLVRQAVSMFWCWSSCALEKRMKEFERKEGRYSRHCYLKYRYLGLLLRVTNTTSLPYHAVSGVCAGSSWLNEGNQAATMLFWLGVFCMSCCHAFKVTCCSSPTHQPRLACSRDRSGWWWAKLHLNRRKMAKETGQRSPTETQLHVPSSQWLQVYECV